MKPNTSVGYVDFFPLSKAKLHYKNERDYLAKKILKHSKLSHGHGHLTHVVCHISCWPRRRKRPSQGLSQGLLKGFHSLWKCILSLLRRLLEVAYPWQLLLSERFKLCWKQLQFAYLSVTQWQIASSPALDEALTHCPMTRKQSMQKKWNTIHDSAFSKLKWLVHYFILGKSLNYSTQVWL